jgi:hypothetical protein
VDSVIQATNVGGCDGAAFGGEYLRQRDPLTLPILLNAAQVFVKAHHAVGW